MSAIFSDKSFEPMGVNSPDFIYYSRNILPLHPLFAKKSVKNTDFFIKYAVLSQIKAKERPRKSSIFRGPHVLDRFRPNELARNRRAILTGARRSRRRYRPCIATRNQLDTGFLTHKQKSAPSGALLHSLYFLFPIPDRASAPLRQYNARCRLTRGHPDIRNMRPVRSTADLFYHKLQTVSIIKNQLFIKKIYSF